LRPDQLADDGYLLLPSVFTADQVDAIAADLASAFASDSGGSTLRAEDGSIYGARNLLQLWPAVADIWRQSMLHHLLADTLGPDFGLVRVLYFDKPPQQSWALPWHKDMTIAVRNNRLPSEHFAKPTVKVGVPHVEAPQWLLEMMLTLRLHLDDMTDANGPLKVLPGSHRSGKRPPAPLPEGEGRMMPVTILGQRGDVLAMRPLLSHCSNKSQAEGTHRRVLHYEFAGIEQLPDGYAWHDFVRGGSSP
jgi:hypothetical protein